MTLIPDASKGLKFCWADAEGNRWETEGGLQESKQAQEIASRVCDLVFGEGPIATEAEANFFTLSRAIATEVLLRDKSTRQEPTP